ncbi:MAG TPA: MBOAT family O-acyltransferase [Caulobacteraceae bacterium]|nr:MBOAT family O-acyltransferase [Caulobacteraceae bacterium]
MLFNSLAFVFGLLPLALIVFYVAGRRSQLLAKLALIAASLIFYAVGARRDLPLLVGSIAVNYVLGELIRRARARGRDRTAGAWTTAGVLANLAVLGWFKYAGFVAGNLSVLVGPIGLPPIELPLGISFYTFVNIAYLIDQSRGRAGPIGAADFALLTGFFPKLISGPLVHFGEFVPQLRKRLFTALIWRNILVGLTIFAIGLFKKTVIADSLATWVNPLFAAGAKGAGFSLESGWLAAFGYTFQLYFDFSGYSDMAIGVARMFGLKLPLNFHSPLRSQSIIEYWRRWHMTIQRMIVSYVFDPLSLPLNRYAAQIGLIGWGYFLVTFAAPIFLTFIAVGVWHGAGWTYVVFGAMHGVYVCANEAWRERDRRRRRRLRRQGKPAPAVAWPAVATYHLLTIAAVAYANVMFRSPNVAAALPLWAGMSGLTGVGAFAPTVATILTLTAAAGLVFLAPNTQQIMGRFDPAWNWTEWRGVAPAPLTWRWKPTWKGLGFVGAALFLGIMFIQRGPAVFIYFQF